METCEKLLTQCLNCSFQLKCATAAAAAKSLQSCPTLCDSIDGSPPGSPIPGILQARTLEWVAISFSNAWKWKVKVKSLSRVRLFSDPMDCSLPGSSVHGIFQARVLEWGAITFSELKCECMLSHFSCVLAFVTLWTVARHAPLSKGFSRQEWSGLLCPPPGNLPDPGTEPTSL